MFSPKARGMHRLSKAVAGRTALGELSEHPPLHRTFTNQRAPSRRQRMTTSGLPSPLGYLCTAKASEQMLPRSGGSKDHQPPYAAFGIGRVGFWTRDRGNSNGSDGASDGSKGMAQTCVCSSLALLPLLLHCP